MILRTLFDIGNSRRSTNGAARILLPNPVVSKGLLLSQTFLAKAGAIAVGTIAVGTIAAGTIAACAKNYSS